MTKTIVYIIDKRIYPIFVLFEIRLGILKRYLVLIHVVKTII